MHKAASTSDPDLPLEIIGYEHNTARDVFILSSPLDTNLERALESKGYVQRGNIVLTDGRIIDGWVKS